MRDVKNIILSLICVIMLGVLMSCQEDDEPSPTLRPALDITELTIEVGDSARLQVCNTDSINFVSTNNPQVISLRIDGTDVVVYALAKGTAIINVGVNGARLKCDVEVVDVETPALDFSKELNDSRSRYVSPSLSIYYDTPGTLFSITDENIIEIRDLSTSDYIKFNPGTAQLKEGTLANASLDVNGVNVSLMRATLIRLTPDGSVWFYLIDTYGNNIILAVTDL